MPKYKSTLANWLFGGGLVAIITAAWMISGTLHTHGADIEGLKKEVGNKCPMEVAIKIQKDIDEIKAGQQRSNELILEVYKLLSEKND